MHVIPEREINELTDWRKLWEIPGSVIKNEYDEAVSIEQMLDVITNRSWKNASDQTESWLCKNHAKQGPNGLWRHTYDATPGEGTYDLVRGEFS